MFTNFFVESSKTPSSLFIKLLGIVTSLWSFNTESTSNPVPLERSESFFIIISELSSEFDILLDTKAITICSNSPISFVRHKAGLTLDFEKSSKGNGTIRFYFLLSNGFPSFIE